MDDWKLSSAGCWHSIALCEGHLLDAWGDGKLAFTDGGNESRKRAHPMTVELLVLVTECSTVSFRLLPPLRFARHRASTDEHQPVLGRMPKHSA
jgi:hypothetical protein